MWYRCRFGFARAAELIFDFGISHAQTLIEPTHKHWEWRKPNESHFVRIYSIALVGFPGAATISSGQYSICFCFRFIRWTRADRTTVCDLCFENIDSHAFAMPVHSVVACAQLFSLFMYTFALPSYVHCIIIFCRRFRYYYYYFLVPFIFRD